MTRSLLEGQVKGRSSLRFAVLHLLALLFLLGFGALHWRKERIRGQLSACKSNVHNMGIAMEMYSVDWGWRYPVGLNKKSKLTPNYLRTIPLCPAAGRDTYVVQTGPGAEGNTRLAREYYIIACRGSHHRGLGVPTNYPKRSSTVGVLER